MYGYFSSVTEKSFIQVNPKDKQRKPEEGFPQALLEVTELLLGMTGTQGSADSAIRKVICMKIGDKRKQLFP